MTVAFAHKGCIGDGCPICKVIDKPGYEAVRAHLTGQPLRLPTAPPPKVSPCVHRGEMRQGQAVVCLEGCNGGWKLQTYDCAVYGSCTLEKRGADTPGRCKGCEDFEPRDIVVNQGAGGLGDALMGSCAILGLRRKHPDRPIVYKTHPATHGFLRLLDLPNVTFDSHDWDDGNAHPKGNPHPSDLQMNPGYPEELRTHGKVTRLERNCRNIGGVVPELPKLRDRERLLESGREYAGAVLLAPFSTWPVREYPLQGWLTLERMLREEGYRVVALDATNAHFPNRHARLRSEKVIDAPAELVTGMVLNAACLVSNDSGLAHLSGITGKPTLVLCGQTSGAPIYGFYGANVNWLEGHLDCRGCWWQPPFNPKCEPTCANLAGIAPGEIVAKVKELAGEPQPPPRGETCKAHARRLHEGWYAEHVKAPCLDVGCWVDFLRPGFPCTRWDQMYGDGDATALAGVPDASYQTVYASHVLEHVRDPVTALRNWWRVLRPGGKLIVCVPHRDLYEGRRELPSRWNSDHKTFWLPDTEQHGHLRGLRQTIAEAIPAGELVSFRVLDEGHYYPNPLIHPEGEFSIEAIVRKP